MNERLVQALIRLVVVFVVAGLSAVGANLTVLQEAIDDPVFAAMVFAVITAVIQAALKYLGGATEQSANVAGRFGAAADDGGKRPNPLAI